MRGRALIGGGLAAFGLVSLGGAAILAWHLREQTRAYFTDADTIDRPAGEASPRDILWRDPTGLPATVDTAGDECAPDSSADGGVLYFARRRAGAGFDLYVTVRSPTGWSEAQPVAALNSDGDEIDPHVSPDGRRLYFASDRPGGSGRFDLWVAALGERGPGEPANLGELVNSAGNECGPALDPGGGVLYFASDRPRDGAADGAAPPGPRRAEERDFDIYASRLDVPGPAEPVAGLNSPFQETTPAVSPAGDFVYFASDRPGGAGGYDLYRARRVRGAHAQPESLGAPVNTPQDELDPEVVLEGFGLYFISKPAPGGADIRYTASREVFQRTEAWRAALRWKAVWAALWPYACWVLAASLLLFLLGKYFTHLKYRKLSLFARCMMASLLAHLVLMVGFAYWIVNVPSEAESLDGSILVSLDLPFPGDGLSLQLLGEGTGARAVPQAPRAAAAQMGPWSAAGQGEDHALGAEPSAFEAAALGAEIPAAADRGELPAVTQSAASHVEPAAAIVPALPEIARATSGEASIVVREPPGAGMDRLSAPAATAGTGAMEALTPGAADLPGDAAVPAGSPGFATPPAATLPARVAGGAPPPGRGSVPALRLPQAAPALSPGGSESSAQPWARPAPRAAGAGVLPMGAEKTPGVVFAAKSTPGVLAPGVMAPMPTSGPRGGGGAGEPRGAGPPPLAVQFPLMDAAAPSGAGAGAWGAGEGAAPRGAPAGSGGASAGRAEYVAAPQGGNPRPPAGPGPIGAAALAGGAERGAMGALPMRMAGPSLRAGREPARALPAAPGLELRIPEAGPPPEAYANRAPEIRQEVLGETGGSAATERAVELALDWLARHQSEPGRWDGTGYDRGCGQCPGPQRVTCDTALTGLSLLCFLAAGHTHLKEGRYRGAVERGLDWLVTHQAGDGGLLGGESMYSHGIASIALAEAYGMTRDPLLERPVRAAVEFIDAARNTRVGGWRYRPGQPGDTSIMGWQVMALKSASLAGIEVPQESFDAAARWLDLVHRPERPGTYAYQPHAPVTPAMTAEGMFIAQLLGAARDEPRMQGSASFLVEHMPSWKPDANTYYWYYATLALFQHQGEAWSTWNESVKDVLLDRQETEGAIAGSWAPEGQWATVAGRVYQTAMAALTLEVYYRYLPRYVQDPGAGRVP